MALFAGVLWTGIFGHPFFRGVGREFAAIIRRKGHGNPAEGNPTPTRGADFHRADLATDISAHRALGTSLSEVLVFCVVIAGSHYRPFGSAHLVARYAPRPRQRTRIKKDSSEEFVGKLRFGQFAK